VWIAAEGVIHRLGRTPGNCISQEAGAELFFMAMISTPGMANYAFGSNPPYVLIP
jgi:hypothetical protein